MQLRVRSESQLAPVGQLAVELVEQDACCTAGTVADPDESVVGVVGKYWIYSCLPHASDFFSSDEEEGSLLFLSLDDL